jgi:DNA mismatch repair protein MSH5
MTRVSPLLVDSVQGSRRSRRPKSQTATSAASVVNDPTEDTSVFARDPEDGLDADSLDQIVMAVDIRERGTVGCAYYVARQEKLFFMEDVKQGGVETIEIRSRARRVLAFNYY